MLKFGIISEVDTTKGLARVNFDDDNIVSGWLPVSVPKSLNDKFFAMPDINEHVWCMMDENAENGVIGGSLYDASSQPAGGGVDIVAIQFNDSSRVEYNRNSHVLTITLNDSVLKVSRAGLTLKKGSETLKVINSDLLNAIIQHTHPTGTGPSGTPINAAAFTAISNRLPNLFEE